MDVKQMSNRQLMALGNAEAAQELQERADRVALANKLIAKWKREENR